MQYDKPEFWKHGFDPNYPCYQRMLQDIERKGFILHTVRGEGNQWKAIIFKGGEWLKDGEKKYSNKGVCIYETLKILYDKLIRKQSVLHETVS